MNSIWCDLMGCEVRYRGNKYRTRTIEAGAGDALILLHGVGGHAEAYSRNIRRLSAHFRVIAIDLLWHGYSSKPPVPDRMIESYGDQVLDLLDSMEIERASIEGESLGGWIALGLALNHPDRLNKIILNTTAGVSFEEGAVREDREGGVNALRARSIAAITNPNKETVRKRLEWLMASPDRVTDEPVDVRYAIYTNPEAQKSLTDVFSKSFGRGNNYTEPDLARITVPTLVLWTDKNPGHGLDAGERIAQAIPGAEFYGMMDAAHWPQWEHPEEHDRVIIDFLNK